MGTNDRFIFIAGILVVVVTLACSLLNSAPDTPTPVPHSLPTSTPASPVPEPQGEPSPVADDPRCVTPRSGASLGSLVYEALPQAILGFLNAGGNPEELDAALKAAAVGNQPLAAAVADLDGDGEQDVVASVFNPGSSLMPPPSTLAIYLCQNDQFSLPYIEGQDKNAHIWQVTDLDANGAAEVLLSWALCGAHTCFEDFQILGWQTHEGIVNRMEGSTAELPYPNVDVLDDDSDGIFDIVIHAAGVGSVGAGPQRDVTYTWRLEPGATKWVLASTRLGESNFRIHVIHDADAAAHQGDYERAVELYLRAINDPTLQDWMEPEVEISDLQAYARYKLVAVLLSQGQDQLAGQIFADLQAEAPAGSRSSGYSAMAAVFRAAFDQGGEEYACQAAQAYAESNTAAVLDPLNDFGYANPAYTAADMCP